MRDFNGRNAVNVLSMGCGQGCYKWNGIAMHVLGNLRNIFTNFGEVVKCFFFVIEACCFTVVQIFGTKVFCISFLLKAAAREIARYKLDLVGVQEVRWDKGGTVRAGDYNFFYGKGNENHQLGTGCFYTKG